jgi:hypothetical protein
MRRVRLRSALRAPTPGLRSSPPQKSPLPGTACRDGHHRSAPAKHEPLGGSAKARGSRQRAFAPPRRRARTQTVQWTVCALRAAGPPGPARPARPGLVARARSAPRDLTCRILFERSERSERSELCDRATRPSIAGNPRTARASNEVLPAARPRLCSRRRSTAWWPGPGPGSERGERCWFINTFPGAAGLLSSVPRQQLPRINLSAGPRRAGPGPHPLPCSSGRRRRNRRSDRRAAG